MVYEVFEKRADKYDMWYEEHRDEYLKELDCFRRIINAEKPWLEIGVGTGRFAAELGIDYGVEPSKSMASYAKKRGIIVLEGVGERLPFPDNFFGAVFIIVTICFVEDPLTVLKEAYRVLRVGGKLYLGIVPRDSELGKLYISKGKKGHPIYSVAKFYSIEEIKGMLETARFQMTKIERAGIEPPDFYCIEAIKL